MPFNLKQELKRKSIHLLAVSFIIIFILISSQYGKNIALFTLVALLILFLELDYIRVELDKKIPFLHKLWREKEKNRFGGQVFFLIGSIISLAVFDFKIAIVAILMTVFGDMAAALIGKAYGKLWITKTRALEGIAAEFFVDLIISYFILNNLLLAVIMSLTATLVETSIEKLDDNLMIPLFSGFIGQIFILLVIP